jgi:hypothetical protein
MDDVRANGSIYLWQGKLQDWFIQFNILNNCGTRPSLKIVAMCL